MSQITIVNIQGRDTAWPFDGLRASVCNLTMRSYYLRWNFKKCCMNISSSRIYKMISDLEIQGHITKLNLFYDDIDREWCAVFDEKCLEGMAQSCWGVGLLEAQLRGLYKSMPNFELCHPWADFQLVAKGSYIDTLQK